MSRIRRGVLVTGASRGTGRATAVAFARQGDAVAVHYGNDEFAHRHSDSQCDDHLCQR
jgi:NAD(P)-dependent dehydrogenase (short-subunit alcohol dehydrogenase family)